MDELIINLTCDLQHFREVYYPDGKSSLFTYRQTRVAIILAGSSLLITLFIYFLSLKYPSMSWLMVLSILLSAAAVIYMLLIVIKFARWKNPIEKYLKDLSKYQSFKLLVTDVAIELSLDKDVTIDRWDTLKSAFVSEKYILLYKGVALAYIFPSKSMKPTEFDQFKEIVRAKLNDCTFDKGFTSIRQIDA